jgi:diacylglycerol O-acyltransferase-1
MRRNWLRIITLCTRLFLSNVLIIFLIAQVISPNLQSLTKDLEDGKHVFSVDIFVDYLLKLAIASTYIWLLVFYSYFHLFFNLLAELVKFGDRVFYKDWWNSSNVSSYWRLWNLPVHYWLGKKVAMCTLFHGDTIFSLTLVLVLIHPCLKCVIYTSHAYESVCTRILQ